MYYDIVTPSTMAFPGETSNPPLLLNEKQLDYQQRNIQGSGLSSPFQEEHLFVHDMIIHEFNTFVVVITRAISKDGTIKLI